MLPVYNGPFTHRTLRCASKTPETFHQRSEATRAPRMCERPLTPYNLQVAVAERLARLTALSEDQGSNRTAGGSCVYRDSCSDIQRWVRGVRCVPLLQRPGRLSLPPSEGR